MGSGVGAVGASTGGETTRTTIHSQVRNTIGGTMTTTAASRGSVTLHRTRDIVSSTTRGNVVRGGTTTHGGSHLGTDIGTTVTTSDTTGWSSSKGNRSLYPHLFLLPLFVYQTGAHYAWGFLPTRANVNKCRVAKSMGLAGGVHPCGREWGHRSRRVRGRHFSFLFPFFRAHRPFVNGVVAMLRAPPTSF